MKLSSLWFQTLTSLQIWAQFKTLFRSLNQHKRYVWVYYCVFQRNKPPFVFHWNLNNIFCSFSLLVNMLIKHDFTTASNRAHSALKNVDSSQRWHCEMNSRLGDFSLALVSFLRGLTSCDSVPTCLTLPTWVSVGFCSPTGCKATSNQDLRTRPIKARYGDGSAKVASREA